MKIGRPSSYSDEIADKICSLIAEDTRNTIRVICALDGMPSMTTLFRWIGEHEYFKKQYARAKEAQADLIVDEMLVIADDGSLDRKTRVSRSGEEYEATDMDVVNRSKLMIETRKWLAGKLRPKKYGDKIEVDNVSSDGSMTPTRIERVIIDDPKDT